MLLGQGMTTHGIAESSAGTARRAVDRSASANRTGSVILVLLVAAVLVAAATGFVVLGARLRRAVHPRLPRGACHSWRFLLFALAAGILRLPTAEPVNPLIRSLVDDAFDGILATDGDGERTHANTAYLDLIDAADASDMRPVERVFIGDADASEAIYRPLKAVREVKRLQEEVRVAGIKDGPRAGCGCANTAREKRATGGLPSGR